MVGWSGHFRKSNIVRPYCGAEQPRPLAQFATICTSTIFTARPAFRSVSSRRDPERFLDGGLDCADPTRGARANTGNSGGLGDEGVIRQVGTRGRRTRADLGGVIRTKLRRTSYWGNYADCGRPSKIIGPRSTDIKRVLRRASRKDAQATG